MKQTILGRMAVVLAVLLAGCGASAQIDEIPAETARPAASQPPAEQRPIVYDQRDEVIESFRGETAVNLHATVTLPTAGENWPVVLLCHGFTGNRRGDGHFAPLAAQLAQAGIACIAVDFAGCGDSEEPYTVYTLTSIREDMDAAIAYMGTRYGADTTRLGLVGHSMGGRAVSLYLDEPVIAAALWSPADNTGLDGLEFLSHDAAEREALWQTAKENGSVELPQWGVTASDELFAEMADSDPCAVLAGYRGEVLLAFTGGDPDLLSRDTMELVHRTLEEREQPFVDLTGDFPDATHNYLAAEDSGATDGEVSARIEDATTEFLIEALR